MSASAPAKPYTLFDSCSFLLAFLMPLIPVALAASNAIPYGTHGTVINFIGALLIQYVLVLGHAHQDLWRVGLCSVLFSCSLGAWCGLSLSPGMFQ